MKKIFALLLAISMVASMAVATFAAAGSETYTDYNSGTTWPQATPKELAVSVSLSAEAGADDVYYVLLKYEDLSFYYATGGWNPTSHSYTSGTSETPSWSGAKNVQVYNHSNAKVYTKANLTLKGENAVAAHLSTVSLYELDNVQISLNNTTADLSDATGENYINKTWNAADSDQNCDSTTYTVTAGFKSGKTAIDIKPTDWETAYGVDGLTLVVTLSATAFS